MAYISNTLSIVFRGPRMEKSMFVHAKQSWFRRVAVAATALATRRLVHRAARAVGHGAGL